MASSDKRSALRHFVVVPVQIDSAERKQRLGVTRDVSTSGTRFLSNSKFALGEKLEVTFYVSSAPNSSRKVQGEVVRLESLQPGLQWRYAMALRFETTVSDVEQVFAELESKEAK